MNLYHTLSSIQCYIKPPWSNILRLYMPTKHSPSASISAGRKAVFANVGLNCCGKEMLLPGKKNTAERTQTVTGLSRARKQEPLLWPCCLSPTGGHWPNRNMDAASQPQHHKARFARWGWSLVIRPQYPAHCCMCSFG